MGCVVNVMDYSKITSYDELIDQNEPHLGNGPVHTIELTGFRSGLQGIDGNHIVFDFEDGGVLEFSKVSGGSVMDLDSNLESVVDTGNSLTFQFIGGGTLTIDGLTGYEDFTSLSMDYIVLVTS